MAAFYEENIISGNTNAKVYVASGNTVINLDFKPIESVIVSKNTIALQENVNYYIVDKKLVFFSNTTLTTGDTINIFYKSDIQTTINVDTKNPLVEWSILGSDSDNGYAVLIVKDTSGNTIDNQRVFWSGNTRSGSFNINNITNEGDYTYVVKNKEPKLLIGGDIVYTESKTEEIPFFVSNDIINKITL